MTHLELRQYIKKAPRSPGVYQFLDANKKAIYIGKASQLRRRLTSYLKTEDSRIKIMIEEATSLIFSETNSEIEALILESISIKGQRPKFNVLMRDDKQYSYVAFSNDDFPRIYVTHQPYEAEAVGPFTDGSAIRTTLRYLRSIFPYCTCPQTHHNFCLNYHIGKCLGYCCLKDNPERSRRTADIEAQYQKNIRATKEILSGGRENLIKRLKKEMESEAKAENFDRAIQLRTTIEKLERVFENARIIKESPLMAKLTSETSLAKTLKLPAEPKIIECYDISNIQGQYSVGAMTIFIDGKPSKTNYRKFKIKSRATGDTGMLREVLERRFSHDDWLWPDLVIIDGGKGQLNTASAVMKTHGLTIPVIGLAKDAKHMGQKIFSPGQKTGIHLKKLSLTDRNLLLRIQNETHRYAISYYRRLHGRSVKLGMV